MRIGVITANYNKGNCFKNYLEGLISQTLKPDVVAYVDDGSNDDSIETIKYYLEKNKFKNLQQSDVWTKDNLRFYLVNTKSNGGPARARNIAIEVLTHEKCDLFCVCDSDDWYEPNKIKESTDVLLKFRHLGLVYTDYYVWNEFNNTKNIEFKPS